jgi:histone H1/5
VTKSSATKKSTAAKKSTTTKKPTVKKAAPKSSHVEHPSWKDIIKVHLLDTIRPSLLIVPQEAITQHREDARTGVSRSAIKKASCGGCDVFSSY